MGSCVAAGEDEAAEYEKRSDGLIAAADESEDTVREKQGGGFEFLTRAGEVVEDDPEGEEEAEASEGGIVLLQGFPDGQWR